MTTKPRKLAGLAALAVLSTALSVSTAGAATPVSVSVSVSGTQTVIDESAGTSAMHGSLVGTWSNTKFVPRFQSNSQFVASGKELFSGCLDSNMNGSCDPKEPSGNLRFTFIYWATFNPASGALLHGQCVHPIVGGTGSFRKVAGVLFMDDTPDGDAVVTTYRGTISFFYDAKAPKSASTVSARRSLSSASAAGGRAGCGF